ncbi:MAG: hypothetical protein IT299_00800, partial [Dehalococcoidia bacterium]|nr:hypothetical protein [Dehalococcoidia bacterium]
HCFQCGQATEVPFVPRGDRPVYCSNCYNDVRSKQEAQAAAEAEAMASRLSHRTEGPSLEGSAEERERERVTLPEL